MPDPLNLVTFKAGEVILLEGEISSSLYILESGVVEVLKDHKVICELSDRKTFFGEMAFILKRRRTATLRAKTEVKALCISNLSANKMDGRLAKASMAFLKVLASRLDLANEETRRLEGYRDFHHVMRKEAEQDPNLREAFLRVEKQVRISDKKESDRLLSDYLKTPWVWTRIEEAVREMLEFYIQGNVSVDEIESYDPKQALLGNCGAISFSGDRDGMVVIDLDPNMVQAIHKGMGLEEEGFEAETTQEISNLVLGNVKKKMQQQSIVLGTPETLTDLGELNGVLKGNPALMLNIHFGEAHMRLIYQLDLTSKVK